MNYDEIQVGDLAALYKVMPEGEEKQKAGNVLLKKIDSIESMDELIELADSLDRRGVIDFGYPKKQITPHPTLLFFLKLFGFRYE